MHTMNISEREPIGSAPVLSAASSGTGLEGKSWGVLESLMV